MASDAFPRAPLYGSTGSPWALPIYPRRRVLIGSEEHKVRVTSALLPDSPFASTAAPNNQVFIPRLNGGRKLHIEETEPLWMTGYHGLPKPAKVHLKEPHWHKQHIALRSQGLTRNASRSVPKEIINIDAEAFEADPTKLKCIPAVLSKTLYADIEDPRPMAGREVLEIVEPSAPNKMARETFLKTIEPNTPNGPVEAHEGGVIYQPTVCQTEDHSPAQKSAENQQETNHEILLDQSRFVFPRQGPDYQRPVVLRNPAVSESKKSPEIIELSTPNGLVEAHEGGVIYQPTVYQTKDHSPIQESAENQQEETNHEVSFDQSRFVFPPRGPDYQKPAMSRRPAQFKPKKPQRCVIPEFVYNDDEEEVETTYEEAIAATLAILTRNERKCTCLPQQPPEPAPEAATMDTASDSLPKGNNPLTRILRSGTPFWTKRKEENRKGKMFNFGGREAPIVPTVKHYEGCILCTPPPSPRSSEEEELDWSFFAPSGQNPGRPPSKPPPSPGVRGTFFPQQMPEGSGPGPSNQSVEDLTDFASQSLKVDHGPYYSESYHNGHSSSLNNVVQLFNSLDFQGGGIAGPESQYNPNLSQSGEFELLTGANTANSRQHTRYVASSSRNSDGDGIISARRGSIFNRGTQALDLESGMRHPSLSNSPILPSNRGGIKHLSDTEIPHPGARVDRQYIDVNGVYETIDLEMVDLNGPRLATPQEQVDMRSQLEKAKGVIAGGVAVIFFFVSLLKSHIRKFWKWCRVQKEVVFLYGFIFCILMSTITVVWIIPAVYKSKASQAHVSLTSFQMLRLEHNSTDITLGIHVTSNDKNHVILKSSAFDLLSNREANARFMAGLSDTPGENVVSKPDIKNEERYTHLGTVFLPQSNIDNGDTNLTLIGTSNEVREMHVAELFHGLVWGNYHEKHGISMTINGYMRFQSKTIHAGTNIRHELVCHATGGFQGLKIDSYEMLRPEDNGLMNATLSWFNPSNVSMLLGDVEFNLTFGEKLIGKAAIPGLKISPGKNTANLTSTLSDDSTLWGNTSFLQEFVSSLIAQASGVVGQKMLRLDGLLTKVNGSTIWYLEPTIRAFSKDLPMPPNPITAKVNTDIRLLLTKDKLDIRWSNAEVEVKLPLDSKGFPVSAKAVEFSAKASISGGNEIFRIAAKASVNMDNLVHTLNNSSVTMTNQTVNNNVVNDMFLPEFIRRQTVPLEITGDMNVNVTTPLGGGYVLRIPLEKRIWLVKGLNNLDGGGQDRVVVTEGDIVGRDLNVGLWINNPSDMALNFGETKFDILWDKSSACVGTMTVQELALDLGQNHLYGLFDAAAPHCDSSSFASGLITGGNRNIVLRTTTTTTTTSSSSSYEINGLVGLDIGGTWVTPRHRLIKSIDILISGETITAMIQWANPFSADMGVNSLYLEFTPRGTSGKTILATAENKSPERETVAGGSSRVLTSIAVTPRVSVSYLVEVLGSEKEMLMNVRGDLGLGWGDYNTMVMGYTQVGVPVRVIDG